MKPLSFGRWLAKQKDSDDPIGDLARDYVQDKLGRKANDGKPFCSAAYGKLPTSSDFRDWWTYLSSTDADSALVTAFERWIRFVQEEG